MRVAVDLDGTVVGVVDGQLALRRGMVRAIAELRRQGHTVILWTFGTRSWWNLVVQRFPVLASLFEETYTRDDQRGHETTAGGETLRVKDVRAIRADLLVDNDPSHHAWAARHGLQDRYLLVPSYGEDPHA